MQLEYPVSEIFHSKQGEGHFVGGCMAFVRLAGCSVVDCHIRRECDEAPWTMTARMRAEMIVARVRELPPVCAVCITGGEPTDHDLLPIICALREAGYRVHLETSGARSVGGYPLDWLTVSPKQPGYVQRQGHTLKLVVRPEMGWDAIDSWSRGTSFFHYYLQPLYIENEPVNLPQVMAMLDDLRNVGGKWFLSTQAHKTWGVR